MTIRKLESQFEHVDRAFAWILMRRFVISAGLDWRCNISICNLLQKVKGSVETHYNQVIPNHPIAKKLLKTKRNTVAVTP